MKYIRNFSIIAHVDHGKSTLSDRIIQVCGGLDVREMRDQVLDSMELERERGITIKSQSVTLHYTSQKNNKLYQLNLIDTPGHVDFSYEVARSLAACEGAVLVIDAAQGVEAQTIANYRIAMELNLSVIIVVNKIDLPTADFDRVSQDIKDIIGLNDAKIIRCSAKTGFGISTLLEQVICDIPSPKGSINSLLQALVIDSWFDNYLGVVSLVCIKNGKLSIGDVLQSMSTRNKYTVDQIGIFTPKLVKKNTLGCGEVGWISYVIKNIKSVAVGDTLTLLKESAHQAWPGFKKIQHYVYAGLFPDSPKAQKVFRNALYKLSLNDASLFYEPESSEFLGLGFRCGFLGLLHMDIVRERLKREYSIDLIVTAPMVIYKVLTIDNKWIFVDRPSQLLSLLKVKEIHEPIVSCNILLPVKYLGDIIALCIKKRGVQISMIHHREQIQLTYELPMSEIILDFFNCIRSISKGYASFEYEFIGFRIADIVCAEILVNSKRIDTLAIIAHRKKAFNLSRVLIDKLQLLIPRQQFDVIVQVAVGKRIIFRTIIKQLRKNVLSKCHGGDVSRKKKLLHNQKEGKKRMKKIGNICLPHSVFLSILDVNNKNN